MIKNCLFVFFQYIAPQHFLSRLAGFIANSTYPALKNFLIKNFINYFGVDLSEAIEKNPSKYESFNEFFTRALAKNARPICQEINTIISPADGMISEIGSIYDGKLLQAKGRYYSLIELIGGSTSLANDFNNGFFSTIYLSPKDYHRVHMPIKGTLAEMIFIPGRLFSVNHTTANSVNNLFSKNERVVCVFDTECGKMAVILVGAMIVASIQTVWAGIVAPRQSTIQKISYIDEKTNPIVLQKGEELGRFLLGSTAIVLFQHNAIEWNSDLALGLSVQMGQSIGVMRTGH